MRIQTIAIIGAGVPGRAIAQIALRAGYRVALEDFSVRTLEEAEASILETLGENADRSARLDQFRNFSVCSGIEDAIRDANLIIETAADELETKLELFTIFDKFARPDAIFATTSTAHSIAEIADVTACTDRCVTLRFTPADNPNRLTAIPGPQTSPDTLTRCSEFAQRLRMEVTQPGEAGSESQKQPDGHSTHNRITR
jgi:3-hydroxyacyl-CoA dehydrogenase